MQVVYTFEPRESLKRSDVRAYEHLTYVSEVASRPLATVHCQADVHRMLTAPSLQIPSSYMHANTPSQATRHLQLPALALALLIGSISARGVAAYSHRALREASSSTGPHVANTCQTPWDAAEVAFDAILALYCSARTFLQLIIPLGGMRGVERHLQMKYFRRRLLHD